MKKNETIFSNIMVRSAVVAGIASMMLTTTPVFASSLDDIIKESNEQIRIANEAVIDAKNRQAEAEAETARLQELQRNISDITEHARLRGEELTQEKIKEIARYDYAVANDKIKDIGRSIEDVKSETDATKRKIAFALWQAETDAAKAEKANTLVKEQTVNRLNNQIWQIQTDTEHFLDLLKYNSGKVDDRLNEAGQLRDYNIDKSLDVLSEQKTEAQNTYEDILRKAEELKKDAEKLNEKARDKQVDDAKDMIEDAKDDLKKEIKDAEKAQKKAEEKIKDEYEKTEKQAEKERKDIEKAEKKAKEAEKKAEEKIKDNIEDLD